MFDIKDNKTIPLKKRKHKVDVDDFAKITSNSSTIEEFMASLPNFLAASDFKNIVDALKTAKKQKPIIWGLGAHVIKTGLNPIIINLMKSGYVDMISLNGAGIIHDTEIALVGETSEEVSEGIADGTFGMVKETGEIINGAIKAASENDAGLGNTVASELVQRSLPNIDYSILAWASRLGVPVTVHVSLGTDIIHMHPNADGAAIGKASMKDFMILTDMVSKMKNGGVFLNVGSAVILPEVFLKAITMVQNQGFDIGNIDAVAFDFNQHYRPMQNVVKRPIETLGGRGYYIIGHHEIMIPLLAASLL